MHTRDNAARQNHLLAGAFALTLSLSLTLCLSAAPAWADDANSKLDRYETQAQTSYDQGDYKRAATNWNKLLSELSKDVDSLPAEEQKARKLRTEKTLRAIGQTALAQKDFTTAQDMLSQARQATVDLATPDTDLDKALSDLAANYREIDPSTLGTEASAALKEVNASKITVAKTDKGRHIEVVLADKVTKPINSNGISDVGFAKVIAFDFAEGDDGIVKIENIQGLKAKVKVWVDIIASQLKKDEANQPVAEVTGQKLGISQSVSTKLPDEIYQPVMGLIARVRTVFDTTIDSGITAVAGTQPAPTKMDIVPVVNRGQMPGSIQPPESSLQMQNNMMQDAPVQNTQPEPAAAAP